MIARVSILAASTLAALASATAAQERLARQAGWLAGCWEARGGARVTLEMWMPSAGGLMIGGSRTTVEGSARQFEHLRLHASEGKLVYTAIPSGQQQTAFTSTAVSDTLLVFENLHHDFPQRIMYRRRGADSVVARAEGPRSDGTTRGFDLPMQRVACGPAAGRPTAPPEAARTADEAAIRRVIADYYVNAVFVTRDAAAVRTGFHPRFSLFVLDGDSVIVAPLDLWLDRLALDGVRSNKAYHHEVAFVDVAGDAAVVRTELFEDGQHIYTDYFNLYRFPSEGWRIVTKIFHDRD